MNGNDISRLSYKELQALAVRYRIPGNIKKGQLITVLRAAKCGNEQEVGRLLTELKQARKKRARKVKSTLTSTPVQSPNCAMGDDYYCVQSQPPYQWVGAEEEIVSREEENNRIPPYEEFRQFLLSRIQRDYQTYDLNNNGNPETSSIIDLRAHGDPIDLETINLEPTDAYSRANIVAVCDNEQVQRNSSQVTRNLVEYQIVDELNGNARAPLLLRRMLQAPVGADLGEIATPLSAGYRIWSVEDQGQNNVLDNSDTLTADSDLNIIDDSTQIDDEYSRFIGNVRDRMFLGQSHPANDRTLAGVEPFANTFPIEPPNQIHHAYPGQTANAQQNCHQWLSANMFGIRESTYPEPENDSSRTLHTVYNDGSGSSCTISRPVVNDPAYDRFQGNFAGSGYRGTENAHGPNVSSVMRTGPRYYQGQNNIPAHTVTRADPASGYYTQHSMGQADEANNAYFRPIHPVLYPEQEVYSTPEAQNLSQQNQTNLNSYGCVEDSTTFLPRSDHTAATLCHSEFSGNQPCSFTQLEEPLQLQQRTSGANQMPSAQMDLVSSTSRSSPNGVLDPYQPRRQGKSSMNSYLENILNFHSSGYIDYSKIDQTSCVYCYTAPIITQSPISPNSSCSQKKRFVAEVRQHSFSPNWLLYNETSIGVQMTRQANMVQETEVDLERSPTDLPVNVE